MRIFMLLYILVATILISALSLISALLLSISKKFLHGIIEYFVALSAGTMIGTAFLHLIPESIESLGSETVFVSILISFLFFFLIERVIHWHHCHEDAAHDRHSIGVLNLTGDAIHNFIDGILLAGTFLIDLRLGILTSITVALHELPQELGDYGVLLYSGWEKIKAIKANLLVSLTMVAGGVLGYFLSLYISSIIPYLSIFAAGGFIYISASDLIPELKNETNLKKSLLHILLVALGISLTYLF